MQHDVDYSISKDDNKCKKKRIQWWLKLSMLFLIMKDSGGISWPQKYDKHKTEAYS